MKKSNKEKPISTIEFAQLLKKLTPSQREAVNNIIDALINIQIEIKKVSNSEGDKGASF